MPLTRSVRVLFMSKAVGIENVPSLSRLPVTMGSCAGSLSSDHHGPVVIAGLFVAAPNALTTSLIRVRLAEAYSVAS